MIMRAIGHSTLRLSYSLVLSDLFFAPAMPSITARGGAFIYPIAKGLCQVFDSKPGESARKVGAYLMMVISTGTCITSAMFLTAMAANPLAALLAEKAVGIKITWGIGPWPVSSPDWYPFCSFPMCSTRSIRPS